MAFPFENYWTDTAPVELSRRLVVLHIDAPAGRRLRVLMRAMRFWIPPYSNPQGVLDFAEQIRWLCDPFSALPLATWLTGRTDYPSLTDHSARPVVFSTDPQLHDALRDLAYEILEDTHEACFVINNPDLWYPGVDEGIEPVSDDHVALVMWGMQRELNRERRGSRTGGNHVLPAVELSSLPWRIQRALAERRRLRYLQFGITREVWERRTWSVWDVPLDADWVPRREARGLAETNDALPGSLAR